MSGYSACPDDPPTGDGRQPDPPIATNAESSASAVVASLLRVEAATQIIDGLARGMTDDAIARSLGVSSRTLNRRMTLMMEAVDARSRFQLGVRLTPELRALLRETAGDAGDEPVRADDPAARPWRSAERLRRQLERRGRPMQAVMWLWVEGDEPGDRPRG